MSSNNTPNWSGPGIGQRIDEAVELIEMELRHAIAYVNDAVIPQVRRESISAMRTAADTLRTLADRFEQRTSGSGPQSNPASARGNPTSARGNPTSARGNPMEDSPPGTSGEPRS